VRLKEVWEEVGRRVFFAAEVQKRLYFAADPQHPSSASGTRNPPENRSPRPWRRLIQYAVEARRLFPSSFAYPNKMMT